MQATARAVAVVLSLCACNAVEAANNHQRSDKHGANRQNDNASKKDKDRSSGPKGFTGICIGCGAN